MYSRLSHRSGFTLVELLIVIAIIGVLATIGLPSYRNMVAKAKRAEAKTSLAGVFVALTAFQTEYDTYGNRLNRMGFELGGGERYYSVGFSDGNCDPQTLLPTDTHILKQRYEKYFDSKSTDYYIADTIYRRTTVTENSKTSCYEGTGDSGIGKVGVTPDGSQFLAAATGNISPKVSAEGAVVKSSDGSPMQDAWTINENRKITHVLDGIPD